MNFIACTHTYRVQMRKCVFFIYKRFKYKTSVIIGKKRRKIVLSFIFCKKIIDCKMIRNLQDKNTHLLHIQ